jgi:hypothetical protein
MPDGVAHLQYMHLLDHSGRRDGDQTKCVLISLSLSICKLFQEWKEKLVFWKLTGCGDVHGYEGPTFDLLGLYMACVYVLVDVLLRRCRYVQASASAACYMRVFWGVHNGEKWKKKHERVFCGVHVCIFPFCPDCLYLLTFVLCNIAHCSICFKKSRIKVKWINSTFMKR